MTDVEKIGKAIKELRQRAGYTQSELAECLDVTDKAVSRWERCLGIPDVSLLAKLCNLLNTDIDNLLEGNITYLEHSWRGVLILDETEAEILPDTILQGKRSICIPMSYFFLAGIKQITIFGKGKYLETAQRVLGNGERFGAVIAYSDDERDVFNDESSLMIVHSEAFLYGPNLTRYFQRAISNTRGICYLAIPQAIGKDRIYFDSSHRVTSVFEMSQKYYKIPICFCKERNIDLYHMPEADSSLHTVEPLGRGMLYRQIETWNDVSEVSKFIRFIEDSSGNNLYCLEEIAWRRGLISKEQLRSLADEKNTYGQHLLFITE